MKQKSKANEIAQIHKTHKNIQSGDFLPMVPMA